MTRITLTIEAEFCGPISMGTVAVIRALMAHLGLSVADAERIVDRCVFTGERVELDAASRANAEALLTTLQHLPAASRIHAALAG